MVTQRMSTGRLHRIEGFEGREEKADEITTALYCSSAPIACKTAQEKGRFLIEACVLANLTPNSLLLSTSSLAFETGHIVGRRRRR
jgi:hypothetical protein